MEENRKKPPGGVIIKFSDDDSRRINFLLERDEWMRFKKEIVTTSLSLYEKLTENLSPSQRFELVQTVKKDSDIRTLLQKFFCNNKAEQPPQPQQKREQQNKETYPVIDYENLIPGGEK